MASSNKQLWIVSIVAVVAIATIVLVSTMNTAVQSAVSSPGVVPAAPQTNVGGAAIQRSDWSTSDGAGTTYTESRTVSFGSQGTVVCSKTCSTNGGTCGSTSCIWQN